MDAAAAQKMLDYLNTYGLQIERVYVSFALTKNAQGRTIAVSRAELEKPRTKTYPYGDVIKAVRLRDGRCAREVIQNKTGHVDHFDWRVDPARALPTGTVGVCQ